MISKATDASIAALGGTCPGSDITARPVTATKAGPVALNIAGVIEGRLEISGRSDLSPSSTLTGQRDDTAGAAFLRFVGTGGRRDGRCMSILDSRKPHAEKVWPHRARSLFLNTAN